MDWVRSHTGPNRMIAEQAALPISSSHGMVLQTEAAITGRLWELIPDHVVAR